MAKFIPKNPTSEPVRAIASTPTKAIAKKAPKKSNIVRLIKSETQEWDVSRPPIQPEKGHRAVRFGEHWYQTPEKIGFHFVMRSEAAFRELYRKTFPNKSFSAKRFQAWMNDNRHTAEFSMFGTDLMFKPLGREVPLLSEYFYEYMPTHEEIEELNRAGDFFLRSAPNNTQGRRELTSGSRLSNGRRLNRR